MPDGGLLTAAPLPARDAAVKVQVCPHPFTTEFLRLEVAAGLTVQEIVERVQPKAALRRRAHVMIGPHYIAQRLWPRVRPNAGVTVMVRMVPQDGGGGKVLRTFLMLAVVALAIAVPYLAPASWGLLTAAGGLSLAGGLVAAGIGIVGNLLVNALVPPPKPSLGSLGGTDRETSPSLQGARNQPIPFGVVTGLLGRFKQTPPLAAKFYTELVGDDQYLRMLVSWGLGLRHFEGFAIGETALSEFSAVEQEHRRGWHPSYLTDQGAWDASTGSFPADPAFGDRWEVSVAGTVGGVAFAAGDTIIYHGLDDAVSVAPGWDRNGDLPHTLYTNDVFEQGLAVVLPAHPNGSARRVATTQPNTDEWSIDISFLQGLISLQDDGDRRPWTRQFLIEIAAAGSGDWQTVTTLTIRAKKAGIVRRGLRSLAPANGQWDIGITPLPTPVSDAGDVFDEATWTALRSFSHVAPLNTPGESTSAFRIKATGQLQGVVSELNSTNTSVLREWQPDTAGGAWVWAPTQNPAAHFREVLQGIANARALPDSKVDLTMLEEWAEKCIAEGWQCNVAVDFETTVGQLLQDIASTGRAARTLRGGKYSVVLDEAGKPTVGHFTPRNTWDFRGTITYPRLPHAFRVRFRNELQGFAEDEFIVYDDGFDENTATLFEGLQLPFITHPDLVWRHARYHIAQARLRRETFTFSCDIEHILCTRGDRSVLAHDVLTVGLAYPRLKALTEDSSGDVVAIEVDEALTMEAGKSYALLVRTLDDSRLSIPLVNAEATVTTVTPVTPVAAASGLAVQDLATFGETGQEVLDILISAIEPGAQETARLTATAYAPAVFTADQGTIPAHEFQGSPTVSILYPVVISDRSDATVLVRDPDGSWQNRILVSVLRPSGLQSGIAGIEARFRTTDADDGDAWSFTAVFDVQQAEVSIAPVEGDIEYEYQLRWVLSDGSRGNWAPSTLHTVIGKEGDPSDVTGFSAQQNGNVVTSRWDQIPDRDRDGYTLRYGQPAVPWRQGDYELTAVARGTQVATLEMPPGTWDLMIKAVDTSGNESGTEARVRITVVSTYDAIEQVQQAPLWPGLHPQAVQIAVTAEDADDWNAGTLENISVSGGGIEITVS